MGKIGPSHLLSEHADLSVFFCFFETVLGREHSEKVSKEVSKKIIQSKLL